MCSARIWATPTPSSARLPSGRTASCTSAWWSAPGYLEGIFRYDGETGAPLGAFIQLDAPVPVPSLAFTPKLDLTQIDDIVALLENARLPSGTEASLNASLRNARVAINEGRLIPAGNELNAFKNKVQANTGNLIPVPQANRMVIAADALRNTLACR